MFRNSFSSERIGRGLAALIALGALAACAEPSAPTRTPSRSSIIIIGGQPIVFNSVLRGIGNPDTKPPTAVEGHLQLKLDETDAGLVASWTAVIVNPECESSLLLGGAIYLIQDSEDFPSPEEKGLYDLYPPRITLGCGENVLQGSSPISDELATRLVEDPDYFVVFFLEGGGALVGPLQFAGVVTDPTR